MIAGGVSNQKSLDKRTVARSKRKKQTLRVVICVCPWRKFVTFAIANTTVLYEKLFQFMNDLSV